MTNKTTNTPPFKVKCTDIESLYLTVDKEYDVVEVDEGFYKVRNDCGITQWYYDSRFEVVTTKKMPQDAQIKYILEDLMIVQ